MSFEVHADNPYLSGPFHRVPAETTSSELDVIGEIPRDLDGLYVRNGPNPKFSPPGRYHWFDGDGMLHALRIQDGRARYTSRYVQTVGLASDEAAGRAQWAGISESRANNPDDGSRLRLKDTANTDVVFFAGSLVSLWYLAGDPYRVDPRTFETLGPDDWHGTRKCKVSAHAKVDEQTGELLFFDYGPIAPFMQYGVVSKDRRLTHFVDVPLPGARMPHDMAITPKHSVLMDLPFFVDRDVANKGRHRAMFRSDLPSRFAVIPRYGTTEQIRWFEAKPCYIYHTINAYEDGDELVLTVCRTRRPGPPEREVSGPLASMIHYLRLDACLYRYRFNLRTGATVEGPLDDLNTEFPSINTAWLGRRNRYAYNVSLDNSYTLTFDGLVKYDLETGARDVHKFGAGRYASEAPFAPRTGATDEDDGYLVTFVHDAAAARSEVQIFSAQALSDGPVARVLLPVSASNGFHACWVPGAALA